MFPSAPMSYVPSVALLLINGSMAKCNASKEVLNCLCILQCILPMVFELESKPSKFEREVLWKWDVIVAEEGVQDHCKWMEQTPQFIIKDNEDKNDVESAIVSVAASSDKQITSG